MRPPGTRSLLLLAIAAALLGPAVPDEARAARVSLSGSDAAEGQRFYQAAVRTAGAETNHLRVEMRSSTIEEDRVRVEPAGDRADDECRQSNRDRRLRCPPLNQVSIATADGDDRITIFGYTCTARACAFGRGNFDNGPVAIVDPGLGRDTVRLDWGVTGEVRLDLRDGALDTVECNGRAVDLELRSRDPQDDIRNCPTPRGSPPSGGDSSGRDTVAPRASLSAPPRQLRRSVLGRGIRAVCGTTEEGSCALTGSISARAARTLGIRTRARRYTIVRASSPSAAAGSRSLQARLTARARAALRRGSTRGLRVLLTATVRDQAGNASSARRTVILRG